MTTTTEQQNYDTLLAGEIPEKLREALTQPFVPPAHRLPTPAEIRGLAKKRVPRPLAEAHVAAERFIQEHHGRVLFGKKVTLSWHTSAYYHGEGADIFEALGAALKASHDS